jgi:lipopolysaccharide export system protein LptC
MLAMREPALRAPRRPQSEPPAAALEEATPWNSLAWLGPAPEFPHSRRVALLKRLLPAIGLALLLLITVWPRLAPLWERMRLVFPAIDLREAAQLRMINPRYAGTDRLGRPYVVTAAVGRQVPDRQDLMSLEAPRADVKTHAGADIVLTAATGIYQSQAQLLDLFGEVTLVHENGTRFVTDSARVDVANNAAEGNDPVEGHGPSGDVQAEGFRILDKGDTIIFTGKSDLLLRGAKPDSEKTTVAAAPPPIATTAAKPAAAAPLQPAVRHVAATGPARAPAARHSPARARPAAAKTAPARPVVAKKD